MSIVFYVGLTTKNKQLKLKERQAIAEWLLKESKEGIVKRESSNQAILFNKSRRTILRI